MVFSGDKAVVYGILKGPSELMSPVDCTASLKGQVLGKPLEYSIPFEVPGNSPSFPIPIIHHLAAKALIKDWERDGGDKKSEIVKLSIESSVVSSHTAFVAVDESNQPVKGAMKTWDITAEMIESEDLFGATLSSTRNHVKCIAGADESDEEVQLVEEDEEVLPTSRHLSNQSPVDLYSSLKEDILCLRMVEAGQCLEMEEEKECMSVFSSGPPPMLSKCAAPVSYKPMTQPQGDPLSSLISLQQADGSWKLDDVIAKVLSKSLKELRDACPVKCDGGVATIWATVLCVVYLELKHPSQKDEWELIAMKADLWLDGQSLPAGADLNKMKEAAKKLVA